MSVPAQLEPLDIRITTWMARHGVTLTRIALGVVFLWFGAIKFVPGWSPAAGLAARTIEQLTFGVVGAGVALPLLAAWESLIGLGLITGRFLRFTLLLLFVQMPGTMLPLFLSPRRPSWRSPIPQRSRGSTSSRTSYWSGPRSSSVRRFAVGACAPSPADCHVRWRPVSAHCCSARVYRA